MLRFRCVEISERSCDSLTSQGEKASVEHRIATGHLRDNVSLSNESREKTTNVLSCSFRVTLGE
jgi:hypothetical protein